MDALTRESGAAQRRTEQRPSDIAIIGVGAVLPRAETARSFWENIINGVDAISEIPPHRWDWRLYYDADRQAPDKIYSKWGGFLADMPFDPMRYGIPPASIKAIDPLQLMTLEVVRQALDDAGYTSDRKFDRERISIILGASGGAGDVGAQYAVRAETPRFAGALNGDAAARLPKWTEDSFAGILLNVAAGRAANRFDFGGVNYTVDAACASSLTAVYQGVGELENGRSDMVVVGGVDTVQGPFGYLCFSKTQALSPRGRCRTFDKGADGIVISEGIAMMVLKRLEDAERDGDRIYAVIKGVGGSSDGRAKSMTAPHPDGQIRALERAYAAAGYSPTTVGLFEAHGTGTVAGDTAELETVTRLLSKTGARPRQSAIGSVKTLIGHTKATAGVAGLIKSSLALYHKVLPPHANVSEPNARISDPASPLYLLREAQPWIAEEGMPRRAAVSAFGFGGTNFHVTLEEHTSDTPRGRSSGVRDAWPVELLLWRAPDAAAIATQLESLATKLRSGPQPALRDLAYTLEQAAPTDGATAALVARADEPLGPKLLALAAHLRSPATQPLPPQAFHSRAPLSPQGRLAVVFAGQGSQYTGMLRELALTFSEFNNVMQRADALLAPALERSIGKGARLSRLIYTPALYSAADEQEAARRLRRTEIAQPALGVVEASLWQLMQRMGLRPDMAAGHSYGEYAALYAAGVLDLESLLRVSEARGRLIVEAAAGRDLGTMAAVQAPREDVERIAEAYPDLLVANHNAPTQSILSGSRESIDAVVQKLQAAGIEATPLAVGAAFHSPFVAPAQARLAEFIGTLTLKAPAFPVYSNTTAHPHDPTPEGLRRTLAEHLGSPVEFVAEIEAMYRDGARIFVGLGPKNVQASLIDQILGERPHRVVRLDDHEGGLKGLLLGLGTLLSEGVRLDLGALWDRRDCREVDLEHPETASRAQTLASHMWLLNGSGARRVGDPLPQPLTLEQAQRRDARDEQKAANPGTPSTAAATSPPHVDTRRPASEGITTTQRGNEEKAVSETIMPGGDSLTGSPADYGPVGALDGERESMLALYQDTMRQFLKTQESIMVAYLTGAATRVPEQANGSVLTARRVVPRVRRVATAIPVATPAAQAQATLTPAPAAMIAAAPASAAPTPPLRAATPPPPPQAQPAPAPVAAAKPAPAPLPAKAPAKAEAAGGGDAETVKRLLLKVVEERTGYPQDMLALDQNLEADLGIDSIKRVEIVGALTKALPKAMLEGRSDATEALNQQKTLQGMISWLVEGMPQREAATLPFELTGASDACAALPRFVLQAQKESVAAVAAGTLPHGLYLLTADEAGVADALASELRALGLRAQLLPASLLEDAAQLAAIVEQARLEHVRIRGVLHLAPISAPLLDPTTTTLDEWREQVARHEKGLARLLQHTAADLRDGGRVLAASALGGLYGRDGTAPAALSAQGGHVGLLKSLREEWSEVRAKAVDLDPRRSPAEHAKNLLQELRLPGGRIEVGYPSGERTIFRNVAMALEGVEPRLVPARDWVVLASGGARGITAETLRALATSGLTLVLAGRKAEPSLEDPATTGLDAAGLRTHVLEKARREGRTVRPVDVQREVAALLQDREIRANLADLRAAGARVEYRPCDLRDETQLAALLDDIYASYGRLDGVVHGAGIIEDKLLVDKTPESWARVLDTKVDSAFLLAKHLRPETLKFLVFFTSVAGRYGNSGQTDYATANELLNRMATQLERRYEGRVRVVAINWGPWEASRHGQGMVSPETRRKFESRGVRLVPADSGAQAFVDEIMRAPLTQVEVIAGEGPWEKHETEAGAFAGAAPSRSYPLIHGGEHGTLRMTRRIDVASDPYLAQHMLDDVPVLPAAVALELFAETAAALWPDRVVTEIRDLRVMRGIRLDGGGFDAAISAAALPVAGESVTEMELRTVGGSGPPHYRAKVVLGDGVPEPTAYRALLSPAAAPLSARQAYQERLFHGPVFQTVTRLVGLDAHGALAEMRASDVSAWRPSATGVDAWLFDPGLVDGAAQMALVWAYVTESESALPSRFGRVRRFGSEPFDKGRMHFLVYPERPEHQVKADVAFVDEQGQLRLLIEQLECTSSPALNRLGGTWKGEICV
jgi:acyl transferase domain-containing protein/NADP-dependent 3-hydroxy acid dehydrogenase YdfG